MPAYRYVLIICHANTSRSVIAEALLRRRLAEAHGEHGIVVRSAGVAPFARDGSLASLDARFVLRDEGIELPEDTVSTDLRRHPELLHEADVVLAMTDEQLEILRTHFPEATAVPHFTWNTFAGGTGDIEDPAGQEEAVFRACKDEIKHALDAVAARLVAGELES